MIRFLKHNKIIFDYVDVVYESTQYVNPVLYS